MIRNVFILIFLIGSSMARMAAVDAVTFDQQPADFTAAAGTTAIFRIHPLSLTSATYAWFENSTALANASDISGANTAELRITATTARNGLRYACRVAGLQGKVAVPAGPTMSAAATLTVVSTPPALAITAPANGTALTGGQVYNFVTNRGGTVWTYDFSDRTGEAVILDFNGLQSFSLNIPNPVFGTLAVTVAAGGQSVTNTYPVAGTDFPPNPVSDDYRFPKTMVFKGYTLTVAAAQGVLANDREPNGQAMSALLVTQPAVGTVVMQTNGGFTWSVPATNPTVPGATSFTYKVSDGAKESTPVPVYLQAFPSPGDLNLDGVVDGVDLEIVTSRMGVHYP